MKAALIDEVVWGTRQEKGCLVITDYTGEDTAVTIPQKIGGLPVIGIEGYFNQEEWMRYSAFEDKEVSSVTIPKGVTFIGDYTFYLTPLTSVTIPDSVTSIGKSAFYGTQLTSVTIPDGVTSIEFWAFNGAQLISVTIPDSVTYIGRGAFRRTQLTSVTIPRAAKLEERVFDEGVEIIRR